MCGIAGFLSPGGTREEAGQTMRGMINTLVHRGPDDGGVWEDARAGIALGNRRLSIVDLSPEGHQPMHSASGRYVLAFNGEIYNFWALREELEGLGHRFRGHSDTEVMLAAFTQWSLERALERFNGMFAFALWDREERCLHLARDRLGEKPLYYGWMGGAFLFGSELKALRAYPHFKGEISRDALTLYLRHNYIPVPYTIYEGISKLPPGTQMSIDAAGNSSEPTPYWSAKEAAEYGVANPFRGSEAEAADELDGLLRDSVRLRMVADVPLGAFLSGGVDSSTVVALMQAQSDRPVKTFSIGFYEDEYSEAEHAKAVAQHLGTEHTELYVTPEEAMAVIPKLPTLYDEPFSDSSQIPTYLVSELARKHVTVSLSGDGGDELFAGYNRYFWGRSIWHKIRWMPPVLRGTAAEALVAISPQGWDRVFKKLGPVLPSKLRQRMPGDRLHKLAGMLTVENPEAMYLHLVSLWKHPSSMVVGGSEPPTVLTDPGRWADLPDFTQRMMYLDTVTYLPDDILVKVDRASMGVSLEGRVPFLDHRLVEFAWQVPLRMKIRDGKSKWLLRQVLDKYVPKELIERPKMGFGVPIDAWLRKPLRGWAEALLDEKRLRREGFFDPRPIRKKWAEHLSGKRSWQYPLWDVLMFQAWLEENVS
ncbi:MAG TPA: asparagine synthase (glutamine-hydrolyzing) [Rubrobacteraceae bacterium]|nr:asparagine synthase (glutamine-hydrolyzing) [Rubrobacteraceae bacterium]